MRTALLFLITLFYISLHQSFGQTYTFDFAQGNNSFVGGVSDFGVNQSEQHEFTFNNQPLPSPLEGENAQYVSGINPSDDLFMYMKRHITGLQPNATYEVTFTVTFASIYPTNAFGVGGPPGEAVTMKAGVTLIEPDTMITDKGGPYVVMNIDKGNQSQPGADMDTIGHVGVSDTTTVYTLKTNDNAGSPFLFTTDASGEAWIIIGTDSGFESATSIYYTDVVVEFSIVSSDDEIIKAKAVTIFPNPSSGDITISRGEGSIGQYSIYDMTGRRISTEQTDQSVVTIRLEKGNYVLQVANEHGVNFSKILIVE